MTPTATIDKELSSLTEDEKRSLLLSEFYSDYWEIPVPIKDWVEDSFYVPSPEQVWPGVKADIVEIFSGGNLYDEVILVEGIGAGKSWSSHLITARTIYELGCLKSPHRHHGLSSSTPIAVIINSNTKTQAKRVVFEEMVSFFNESPWFQEHLRPDPKIRSELRFLRPISYERFEKQRGKATIIRRLDGGYWEDAKLYIAPEVEPTGLHVYSAIMDEVFARDRVADSRRGIGQREYDGAQRVHSQLMKRMRSRFAKKGGHLPGMLIMIGSPRYPDDFGETKYNESKKEESRIFGRRCATWANKAPDDDEEVFYIDLKKGMGTIRRNNRGKVAKGRRSAKYFSQTMIGDNQIEVPMRHLQDAKDDLPTFLRDMATIPVTAIRPFYINTGAVQAAVNKQRMNPFKSQYYQNPSEMWDKEWKPDTAYARYMHVDLAVTRDAVGISGCYVDRYVPVVGKEDSQPHIVFDFMGRLVPDDEDIEFDSVLQIIYDYADAVGYIGLITFDQFQSTGHIQTLRNAGFTAAQMSIDRTTYGVELDVQALKGFRKVPTEGRYASAQEALRSAVNDGRADIPDWKFWKDEDIHYFVKEALEAEYNELKGRVDHRPRGSIDVLQSMAGAAFNACNNATELDHDEDRSDRIANLKEEEFMQFYDEIGISSESEIEEEQEGSGW